jgi:bacterioferritin
MAQAETGSFLTGIEELRRKAREHIEDGAVTMEYGLDRNAALGVLNQALATEVVCVLRYMQHYYMAAGIASESVKAEFLEHARAEQHHADRIAARITQLNGSPDLSPASLATRSQTEYVEVETLVEMVKENLVAERIVITGYNEIIRFFGDRDPTSRLMFEEILREEEDHANDLADLLKQMTPR